MHCWCNLTTYTLRWVEIPKYSSNISRPFFYPSAITLGRCEPPVEHLQYNLPIIMLTLRLLIDPIESLRSTTQLLYLYCNYTAHKSTRCPQAKQISHSETARFATWLAPQSSGTRSQGYRCKGYILRTITGAYTVVLFIFIHCCKDRVCEWIRQYESINRKVKPYVS